METHDRQFVESLDGGLRDLDRRLADVMRMAEPPGLCDGVEAACHGADAERLRRALRVATPAGLAERVYVASVRPVRPGVAGRIGPAVRVAAAACVLLACGLGLWFRWSAPVQYADNGAWIENELARAVGDVATARPHSTELDQQIVAFALDVERTALSMEVDLLLDPLGAEADMFGGELDLIETEYDAF